MIVKLSKQQIGILITKLISYASKLSNIVYLLANYKIIVITFDWLLSLLNKDMRL